MQDKTVEYPQTAVTVNGPSRCSRIQHRTHTRHAHDQDTAVIPIPMKHPIDTIRVSKESGKPVTFTKPINKASGKESFKDIAFSFASWGLKTMEYLAMIREDLHEKSRQKI